jgi:hypothetical protein
MLPGLWLARMFVRELGSVRKFRSGNFKTFVSFGHQLGSNFFIAVKKFIPVELLVLNYLQPGVDPNGLGPNEKWPECKKYLSKREKNYKSFLHR